MRAIKLLQCISVRHAGALLGGDHLRAPGGGGGGGGGGGVGGGGGGGLGQAPVCALPLAAPRDMFASPQDRRRPTPGHDRGPHGRRQLVEHGRETRPKRSRSARVFGIDTDMKVKGFADKTDRVPELDSTYKFDPDTRDPDGDPLQAFRHNRRVMIQGYHRHRQVGPISNRSPPAELACSAREPRQPHQPDRP